MSTGAPLDLQHALAVARGAALEAGELLLAQQGKLVAGEIATKSAARDLVTKVDLACERAIVARLRAAFPGHAIEAEEEVRDARDDERPRWFVDPLDGTVNFVHGLAAFGVSIALYRGREPQVGVVHLPRLCETFCALRGGGATLDGRAIHVSSATRLADALLATGFPYRRNELAHSNLEYFGRLF